MTQRMVLDGVYYALGLAAGGAVAGYSTLAVLRRPSLSAGGLLPLFLPRPDRAIPEGPVAVSPADGKVVSIKAEDPPPPASASF